MSSSPPLHIFLVNNPVVQLLSTMVVLDKSLSDSDTFVVSVRNADCSLLGGPAYSLAPPASLLNRLLVRLGIDLSILRLSIKLRVIRRPFYIYASWDYQQVKRLSLSPLCKGKYYIEEGQLAYLSNSIDKLSFFDKDNLGGVCISSDAFKWMSSSQKKVYADFSAIQPLYRPKLQGIINIGLMPQPHRIPRDKWLNAFELLAEKIGRGGAIKLHPGFYAIAEWIDEVNRIKALERFSDIKFCDNSEILEVEMVYQKKQFFGARTSIQRYAKQMGSEFNIVQFEGYISSDIPESNL